MHIPPRIPVHDPWPVKDTQDQICSGNQCPQLHQLTHDSFLVTVGCNHQCVWCCILASMMNSLQFWESNHWRSQHWRKHRVLGNQCDTCVTFWSCERGTIQCDWARRGCARDNATQRISMESSSRRATDVFASQRMSLPVNGCLCQATDVFARQRPPLTGKNVR